MLLLSWCWDKAASGHRESCDPTWASKQQRFVKAGLSCGCRFPSFQKRSKTLLNTLSSSVSVCVLCVLLGKYLLKPHLCSFDISTLVGKPMSCFAGYYSTHLYTCSLSGTMALLEAFVDAACQKCQGCVGCGNMICLRFALLVTY